MSPGEWELPGHSIPARQWIANSSDSYPDVTSLTVETTDEGMVALSVIDGPATNVLCVLLTPEQYGELVTDGIRRLVLIRGHRAAVEAVAAPDITEPGVAWTLSVIRGEVGQGANGDGLVCSALEGVDLGDEVWAWLEAHGYGVAGDDLTWVLVTPGGEDPGELSNLVAQCQLKLPATETTDGASLIASERARQVASEGWTPAHDDQHIAGELALAAASYAQPPGIRGTRNWQETGRMSGPPTTWPGRHWEWQPSGNRIDELVKAGALVAAEIDRRLRELARARADGGGS